MYIECIPVCYISTVYTRAMHHQYLYTSGWYVLVECCNVLLYRILSIYTSLVSDVAKESDNWWPSKKCIGEEFGECRGWLCPETAVHQRKDCWFKWGQVNIWYDDHRTPLTIISTTWRSTFFLKSCKVVSLHTSLVGDLTKEKIIGDLALSGLEKDLLNAVADCVLRLGPTSIKTADKCSAKWMYYTSIT